MRANERAVYYTFWKKVISLLSLCIICASFFFFFLYSCASRIFVFTIFVGIREGVLR